MLFTSESSSFFQEYVAFDHPNGKLFEFTNPAMGVASFANQNLIVINCDSLGTIDNAFVTSLRTMTVIDAQTGGFTFGGTIEGQLNISNFLALSWAGTLIDLSTALFSLINITPSCRFISPVGTTILSGLANSGNIATEGRAIVEANIFNGEGTALSGIDTDDLQWIFKNNLFVDNSTKNSEVVADTFLTSPIVITISSEDVYVAAGGVNWVSDLSHRFTVSTAGLVTYIGLETVDVFILSAATVSKVGGGEDILCTKIAINGTVSDKTIACTENNKPTSIVSQGLFELETGDTIQLFVANTESTANIELDTANMTISQR